MSNAIPSRPCPIVPFSSRPFVPITSRPFVSISSRPLLPEFPDTLILTSRPRRSTNFEITADNNDFMLTLQKILAREPGFNGIGGHEPKSHNGHGLHRQLSIGLDGRTINFREGIED